MLLVAAITMCYTLFGGFLGASLTDVAQAVLMFAALVTIPVVTIIATGGPGELVNLVQAADAAHNAANPGAELNRTSVFFGGSVLALVSPAAWCLGACAPPHPTLRVPALRSP